MSKQYIQMDPKLQHISAYHDALYKKLDDKKSTIKLTSYASHKRTLNKAHTTVIAKISNIGHWKRLLKKERICEVPNASTIIAKNDKEYIVTARIANDHIEYVRNRSYVRSLKSGRPVNPLLKQAKSAVNWSSNQREIEPTNSSPLNSPSGGKNVVVGIIDEGGADFMHKEFQRNGKTRFLSIWRQSGGFNQNSENEVSYGVEFKQDKIDMAIEAANNGKDAYAYLGYLKELSKDPLIKDKGLHGTHVADIAAGNNGFAPNADIIFVDTTLEKPPKLRPREILDISFANDICILEGVKYIFDRAGDKPCVVNISLGSFGGPHDGSTLIEQGIDWLIKERANRAVVVSAGNAFDDGIHTAGTVPKGDYINLSWKIKDKDKTYNELELWYSGQDRIAVELINPRQKTVAIVEPGKQHQRLTLFITNRLKDPNNKDNVIGIYLAKGALPGFWTVCLHARSIPDGGLFHAWIERDHSDEQSGFMQPSDNSYTLGSFSCGRETIVVGSYNGLPPSNSNLSNFSSAGPTRDSRQKPDISAPGHIAAAWSFTTDKNILKKGTSMAAPVVTGVVALMLSEVNNRNSSLSGQQIRNILTSTARRDPPVGENWHPRFGFGRVDAQAALQAAIDEVTKRSAHAASESHHDETPSNTAAETDYTANNLS